MKLVTIFLEQIRSGEIWRRFWDFNRLKPYKGWDEYKERTSRNITKEDVPALVLTAACGILLIGIFNSLTNKYHNISRVLVISIIAAFGIINAIKK